MPNVPVAGTLNPFANLVTASSSTRHVSDESDAGNEAKFQFFFFSEFWARRKCTTMFGVGRVLFEGMSEIGYVRGH